MDKNGLENGMKNMNKCMNMSCAILKKITFYRRIMLGNMEESTQCVHTLILYRDAKQLSFIQIDTLGCNKKKITMEKKLYDL